MPLIVFLSIVFLFSPAVFAQDKNTDTRPRTADPMVTATNIQGTWVSQKIDGDKIIIRRIEIRFQPNGVMTGKAWMEDGKVDEKEGTFELRNGRIITKLKGETHHAPADIWFERGLLKIRDVKNGVVVTFKKNAKNVPN